MEVLGQEGDLGTGWRGLAFNDSAWASGAGPLGYGESVTLHAVWGSGPDDIFIVGHDGTIRHYYGVADYSGIHGTGAGNVWAVGSDHPAGAACSISRGDRYDGSTWSHAVPYPYDECHGFTDVVAGAPGAEDGVWIFGRDDLVDADYRGSELWAVGDGQKIVRWTGSAWERDR